MSKIKDKLGTAVLEKAIPFIVAVLSTFVIFTTLFSYMPVIGTVSIEVVHAGA